LQRISSYLHFRGEHPGRLNSDRTYSKLVLTDCDIAKELNGHTFDSLPSALQIKLKRNFVRVEVIRRESDKRLRYYVFKRLNTGGSLLSDQEIRNCTIRLLDNTFNSFSNYSGPQAISCAIELHDICRRVDDEPAISSSPCPPWCW
jgi:hypothetical protein